jgi:hypothetical protein
MARREGRKGARHGPPSLTVTAHWVIALTKGKPMSKMPARSILTLRDIQHRKESLLKLKALKDSVKDKRQLVPEALKILIGEPQEPGEHTTEIYKGIMRLVEMEIEAGWADYLKYFRKEQDQGGEIAAAWPDDEEV